MSEISRAYQTQITGETGQVWVENGVKFDGMINGQLIEVKGDYSSFVNESTGSFQSWFTGAQDLVDQANRQLAAANGVQISWYFMNQGDLDAVGDLFAQKGVTGINLIYQPLR